MKKTTLDLLQDAYKSLEKSTDPEVAIVRRDLYLIIEDVKGKAESNVRIGYFYNEKGDYTITLHDEPVAVAFTETDALKIVNHVRGLSLRVDVMSIHTFSIT